MGRRPSSNPLLVQLSFRVDKTTGDAIDGEIKTDQRPGEVLSRGDMARMLIAEALAARDAARRKPRKPTK